MQLQTYREMLGISRSEAARKLAVTETTYYRWEKYACFPRSAELTKIKAWSRGAVMPNDFLVD